jgi:Flp pilus assembly protein TadG
MMKKLDQRGVAALEFCLVAVPLFTLMFAIFDLGRYAITMHSLHMLANAEARANMINCYTPAKAINNTSPSTCTGDYLSDAEKQTVAPFAYGATVNTTAGTGALTVTTYQQNFTMIMPIWPEAFNATVSCSAPKTYACVSTSIPF